MGALMINYENLKGKETQPKIKYSSNHQQRGKKGLEMTVQFAYLLKNR